MKSLTIVCLLFALVLSACTSTSTAPDINQTTQAIDDPGNTPPPPQPPSGPAIQLRDIASGSGHSCGINPSGKAYCWGDNYIGQLGNGTNADSNAPQALVMPAGVTLNHITAGHSHTCALGSDSKTYCWGLNKFGQLGNNTNTNSNTPKAVIMPSGVTFKQISAGTGHTCALGSNSKAYCWGDNWYGQLGNSDSGPGVKSNTPQAVVLAVGFKQISAGAWHTCALGSDSKAYCWGYNKYGQLGNGTNADSPINTTVLIDPGVSLTKISAGQYHTCALDSNKKAHCWGYNLLGQLGSATYTDYNSANSVSMPGLSFTHLDAGKDYTCALGSDSKTYCWGDNQYGQLGNGTNTKSNEPVAVSMPVGVNFGRISGGRDHTCTLGSDMKTYCWGRNLEGQLGNGTNVASNIPVPTLPY